MHLNGRFWVMFVWFTHFFFTYSLFRLSSRWNVIYSHINISCVNIECVAPSLIKTLSCLYSFIFESLKMYCDVITQLMKLFQHCLENCCIFSVYNLETQIKMNHYFWTSLTERLLEHDTRMLHDLHWFHFQMRKHLTLGLK